MQTQTRFKAQPFQLLANPTPLRPPAGFLYVDQANYALVPMFQNPQTIPYLYSDSATSCIIVIGMGTNRNGEWIASLAHLDSPACIQDYFQNVLDPTYVGEVSIYAQGANPPENQCSIDNANALKACLDQRKQGTWTPIIQHLALQEGDPRRKDRGDYGVSLTTEVPIVSNQPFDLELLERDPTGGAQTLFCIMRRHMTPPIQLRNAQEPFDPTLIAQLVQIATHYQKVPSDPTTAFTYIINLTSEEVRNTWSSTPDYEAPWFSDELKQSCCYTLLQAQKVQGLTSSASHLVSRTATLSLQELNPADVLLFSGVQDDWISRAIMALTGSPISHAALWYRDGVNIIEEVGAEGTNPGGVEINPATTRFEGRNITVRRSIRATQSMGPNTLPVLDAADVYKEKGEPFAMSNLVIVGILLLYKKLPHTMPPALQSIVTSILEKLAQKLMDEINEHKTPGKQPMFCSQFAFQCYQDAGPNYQLRIVNGLLLKGTAQPARNLLDHALAQPIESWVPTHFGMSGMSATHTEARSMEELLHQLVDLIENGALEQETPGNALDPKLMNAVKAFAQAIHATYGNGTSVSGLTESLTFAKSQEACFVTPADLYSNCPDLVTIGTIA